MSEIFQKVADLKEKILKAAEEIHDEAGLKVFQDTYMSKKSELSQLMGEIRNLEGEDKTKFGQAMNEARGAVTAAFQAKQKEIQDAAIAKKLEAEKIDITLPSFNYKMGGINPFYLIQDEIIDTFVAMGYEVKEGPDVESDYYNFERMNIPADHPAREMQDSLYINPTTLLRTHTSP
ncbi:MAG: phenylalanine--tRNA ligase subunit alpha, partial [Bacilli bacterium]|nr:phenylalanine--tRNA ligase subunit alpha [Bacilli bacterium]